MANMCSNIVTIERWYSDELKAKFQAWLSRICNTTDLDGWENMPEGVEFDNNDRFLFDPYTDDEGEDIKYFSFESKWSPAASTMEKIAQAFEFDFLLEFEEGGDYMYGELKYNFGDDYLEYKKVDPKVYENLDDTNNENLYTELEKLLEETEWKPWTE